MRVTVKITGQQALLGSLSVMNVHGRVLLEKAVDRSSAAVLAGAEARVPVGGVHDPHPGELKKTLRRRISASGMSAAIMAGYGELVRKGRARTRQRLSGRGSSQKGVYAPPAEFGTAHAAAHPFLFPALHAEGPAFIAACEAALEQTVAIVERAT